VNAHDTVFRGQRFRSRLEARWAAFFDLIGWRWEYEPFDGDFYIPDFAIVGEAPLLVEIKPHVRLSDLKQNVERVEKAVAEVWEHDVLFLGASPFPADDVSGYPLWMPPAGLLSERGDVESDYVYANDPGLWNTCGYCRAVSVHHSVMWYRCRPCGHHDGDHYLSAPPDDLTERWNRAGALVRWEAK